jgi:hypothetical protein
MGIWDVNLGISVIRAEREVNSLEIEGLGKVQIV